MQRAWVSVHRYLSLVAAVFWLVQALTGIAIVFRWELDDAMVAGQTVPVQPAALGARMEAIERDRGSVYSLWASSSAAHRFDIYYADSSGADRVMRIDGAGQVLRDGPDGEHVGNGGIFNTLTLIHHSLLSGRIGEWIVAVSGLLLLTNLVLGVRVAWPRAGAWRRALFKLPSERGPARVRGLHRMVGLWGAIPAFALVSAGVLLAFEDGLLERLAGGGLSPDLPALRSVGGTTAHPTPEAALNTALTRYPGSLVSALAMPSDEEPWYEVRLHAPGEMARNWGKTTVFVDAVSGAVLGDHDGRRPASGRGFVDSLYPVHTGQWARTPGRILTLLNGVWLTTMIVLGVMSWLKRRSRG